MPTVQFSRKHLEHLVGKKLGDDVLKTILARLGTGCDAVDASSLTVEIEPNRPDLLSEAGMARAMMSLLGIKTGLRRYDAKRPQHKVLVSRSVAKVRPRTACAIVKGLSFDDEKIKMIIQMQEKLHVGYCRRRKKAAIGIYPLEHIEWPVRYDALAPSEIKFMPLDANREMTASQILGVHAAGKEYGALLSDAEAYPVFIDNQNRIMSMPPIINSTVTGRVSESTTDVFIECSGFDQGVLDRLLAIIVSALADEGGIIHSVEVVYPGQTVITPKLESRAMNVNLENISRRLGIVVKENDARVLLAKMGLGFSNKKVLIPCYRADMLHEVDIAEEIAIASGYDSFEPMACPASTVGTEQVLSVLKARIAATLVGLGMQEVNTLHIDSLNNQTVRSAGAAKPVRLANALTVDYDTLRRWMLPSVLQVFAANKHRDYPQKVFAFGSVFVAEKSETGIVEKDMLALALSHSKADYTEARQVLGYALQLLGMEVKLEEHDENWAIPGRCAMVSCKGKRFAVLGEVHPQVLSNWQLETPVVAAELDMHVLLSCLE